MPVGSAFPGPHPDQVPHSAPAGRHAAAGFTYLGVLAAIALMGVALMAVSDVWVTTANRQKMAQLEWAGDQYAQAIGSYYYANVGSVRFYPKTVGDLIEDRRYLSIKRHLREPYPNPFTDKLDWQLIAAPDGGFRGVQTTGQTPMGPVLKSFVFTPVADGASNRR